MEPTLPPGITLFLAERETIKQPNTTTGPTDTQWPIPREGPQWSSTIVGGARPKIPVWSSTAQSQSRSDGLDPVSYFHRWIHAKIMKITNIYWWKELKASGRMAMHSCVISEGLTGGWSPSPGLLAGCRILTTPGSTGSSRVVGPSAHNPWASTQRLHAFHHFLWLLGNETAKDHGLSLGTAGLHWGVRVPHRSSLWFSAGTTKVHGSPVSPCWWWNSWGSSPNTHRRGMQNLPTTRGGSHSPGWN